jgi:hypothetical protein
LYENSSFSPHFLYKALWNRLCLSVSQPVCNPVTSLYLLSKAKRSLRVYPKALQRKAFTATCQRASSTSSLPPHGETEMLIWDWGIEYSILSYPRYPYLQWPVTKSATLFWLDRTHTACNLKLNEDSVMKSLYS